jgi:hypothetical protein
MKRLRLWYRKLKCGEPVIVVSGLPRSGTSMMMRMLAAGGLEILTDGTRKADEDNPAGYFEFEQVKELEKSPESGWLREARGKGIKIISQFLRHLPRENRYRVLLMQRDLGEVLASQRKMLERRGEAGEGTEDTRLRGLFDEHMRDVRAWLRGRRNFDVLEVEYGAVLADPEREAERICAYLRCRLDPRKMASAVNPALYRNRKAGD